MSNRTRRSASEILADMDEKRAKLELRVAKEQAMENPSLAPLVERMGEVESGIRETSKLLGNSPQSLGARLRSHELWIEEINAQRTLAEAVSQYGREDKGALSELLSGFVATLAEGGKVTKKSVNAALKGIPSHPEIEAARTAFETAQAARKAHTEYKRAPRRNTEPETEGTEEQETTASES